MIVVSNFKFIVLTLLLSFFSCKQEIKSVAIDGSNRSSKPLEIKLQDEKEITFDNFVKELNSNLNNFNGNYISKIINKPLVISHDFEQYTYNSYEEFRSNSGHGFFYDVFKNVKEIKKTKNPFDKESNIFYLFGLSSSLEKIITYEVVKKNNFFYINKINIPSEPTDEP